MKNALFHGGIVNSKRILYTPSTFAKISLMHIQEIGLLQAQKPHTSKRDHLSSFLFFIVISGSGTLHYRDNTYSLSAGSCIFIDCRYPYAHQTANDLWQLKWIHFYGPTLSNIYDKYIERGGQPCFDTTKLCEFEKIWQKIYDTANSEDYIRDMHINEQLCSLLTLIMTESWQPALSHKNSKRQNLIDIRNYLDDHYTEKILLDDLAKKFYINKFYLTRIFKEQFGISVHNYLIQKKITHAKQLLRFSNKTLEEIGAISGIGDLHYFSKLFKKIEGISPSEYRKMW